MRTLKLSDRAEDILVNIVLLGFAFVVGLCLGATCFLAVYHP